MKAYMIVFDPQVANIQGVHTAITTASGVVEWWHYINGAYIVTTNLSLYELKNRLEVNGLTGGNYLIIEVHRNSGGLLPVAAWNWINTRISL